MKVEKFKEVHMLRIKPGGSWSEPTRGHLCSILPLSEGEEEISFGSVDSSVETITKASAKHYEVLNVPTRYDTFFVKNTTNLPRSYLVFLKEKPVGRPAKEFQ